MFAFLVEDSRGQKFHVHLKRDPDDVIGRDTNVPCPPECVAFHFPASEIRNIELCCIPRFADNGVRLDSAENGISDTVVLSSRLL